jgi:hypothetical protein
VIGRELAVSIPSKHQRLEHRTNSLSLTAEPTSALGDFQPREGTHFAETPLVPTVVFFNAPKGKLFPMSPHDQEGIAGTGLSAAILPWVEDPGRLPELRQFLSQYIHKCRNSLHGLKMSLYLFRRGMDGSVPDTWSRLERTYHETERLLDRLQQIYRPMATSMVRSSMGDFVDERLPVWRSWFAERGLAIRANPPAHDPPGEFDPMQLASGLDAFIAWRLEDRLAPGTVQLGWQVRAGWFEVEWSEVDADRSRSHQRQMNDMAPHLLEGRCVDSLALPLLARIAAAHGGRVTCSWNPACSLIVSWPQFQDHPVPSECTS